MKKNILLIILLFAVSIYSCNRTTPSHHLKNGSAKYQLKNYSEAIDDLDEAIRLKDDYSQAYHLRALCYSELGKLDMALADFNKAIVLDPEMKAAYLNRAFYVKEKKNDLEGALKDYNTFIKLNEDDNNSFAYNNRGFVKFKMGKTKEALKDIYQSIQIDSTNSYAYKNLALIYIGIDSINLICPNLQKAESFGYSVQYDNEVIDLIGQYCND